ncbi:uncharacterized protein LOC118624568 isoform X1 [Molossus molossus]|uniref:uncharacterized protein LOC118624568 isoform X1 n=1 Tax=Molossus molossus TaxID=27622 RepID=UPI00174663A6|nr:uncharacterized protein LOC118624568 isoform X1 [Molossus molossus]
MPEEVTYATLNFPNSSTSKKLQESCSLKRTDNHEVLELELEEAAENGPRRVESTVEVAESRAVRGPSVPMKVWGPVAFILLMLNLAVLTGLGTLILMNYHELFFRNRTAFDKQESMIEQLERNVALYIDMYKNVSSEHIVLKNMLVNTSKELNRFTSKYSEDLRQKKKDLELYLCACLKSCTWLGDSRMNFSCVICDNKKKGNKTQLFTACPPSPVSRMDLNCTLTEINKAENVSKCCTVTLNQPVPSVLLIIKECLVC